MWDYRTLHCGTENRSTQTRALLYVTYGKPWWRDMSNYRTEWRESGPVRRQRPLMVGQEFLRTLPEATRYLFRQIDSP